MNHNNLLEAASFSPDIIQAPTSAWLGHLPFAGWVIREVKPRIFVELGTHFGHSYFAFCQAVAESDLTTKCYAVDTWQGDEHAGKYGDEVFDKVLKRNEKGFAEFSHLIRMTFDSAVSEFPDESIDLLHIDGLHSYEAVLNDFKTWLPKLAPGAVVMFHDTQVRERNFGVWKLWGELQECYTNNLEFVHSFGLGVLQLNNAAADKNLSWLQPESTEKQQLIEYFTALGRKQMASYELNELKLRLSNLEVQIADLNGEVKERDKLIHSLLSSISWRMTEPLRWFSKLFSRGGQQK